MLSISLDPLSAAKQSRQPSHARSLFPLPRSNHVNPEGHARPPYADGPVQVVKGVWIGNEESVERFDEWVGGAQRGMIVNVAKELEDPFKGQDQEQMERADNNSTVRSYAATEGRPALTYLKLDWTHGETDLASETPYEQSSRSWGFRETIERMEQARTAGISILIHCQCGISRSATLIIAYVLWLSHRGLVDEDGLKQGASMWDANDYVKRKSEWVGPNVS
ncbi:hypothetical protein FFLO_01339 [Filobasidium floriforme]|uniref:protein-tyrosine-phosphatase n=1 Tax=Filobasidium floriforme TaxID=5210 RepID=A0A8K0JUX4_9TREE|nr:hypothetical protein FFLO_01339 [Filobasidium floriforme]